MPVYSERSAIAALAEWLECEWLLEGDGAPVRERIPPDGCLDIVYDRTHGLRAVGAMTVEQDFELAAGASIAGVRFRPGMAGTFLHISPAELTDGCTPLEDLWPRRAGELRRRMDDTKSMRDAMRILLLTLQPRITAQNSVQRAIAAITASNGSADLDSVAVGANLSARQFRRRCQEESGLTPKLLSRILRFRHACRLARALRRPNWSRIALDAEYFDQAHLIRDFREFTGLTPMAVFSNTERTCRV